MEEIRLFILLSILFSGLSAVPIAEFYPFGESEGDSKLQPNDDGSSPPVLISSLFPFFNKQHHNLTVNTNGVISFLQTVSQFTPDPFPLAEDKRLIAAYWADVDIRNGGNVWYRESTDSLVLFQATTEVLSHASALNIRDLTNFRATWVFVATWEDVAFYGASDAGKSKRNTFQIVLVTNGRHSFVIFNYAKIEWTTGTASDGDSDTGLGGKPAQVGFNAGDGINFYTVEGSRTADIINLLEKSNIGIPGKFIFRVDDADIQDGGCNTEGTLTLTPRFGNMLGGHYLYVSGPCFQRNPNANNMVVATLKFDISDDPDKAVDCIYEDDYTARCVAPATLFRTGHIQVSLTRQDAQAGTGTFIGYYSPENIVRHPPMLERVQRELWGEGNVMKVCWEPAKVKAQLDCFSDNGRLDVLSYKENINGPHWKFISSISDYVNINSECATFQWQGTVSLNSDEKVGILRLSCEGEDIDMYSTAVWSDVHDLNWIKEPVGPAEAESICEEWIDRERLLPFLNFTQVSEPCPCQLRQALIDAGRFHPDPLCYQGSTSSTNCKDYIDAIHCVHSNAPKENTAGQRCCYDNQGELLHEPFQAQSATSNKVLRSAGRASRYHYLGTIPHKANGRVPYLSNFLGDEIPFLECCVHNFDSIVNKQQCYEYMQLRPASDCTGYVPPRPASLSGDPHLVTLDGFRYTFNGIGEYVVLETRDQSFILQGRTEQAKNSDGHLQPASVFTAVAIKTNTSDAIQVQLNEITMVEVIVNGEKQNFEAQPWQDFQGASIFIQPKENNTEVTIMFMEDEVAVLLDATRDMMNVMFLGPETIKGTTRGLLGTWNDDVTDDLMISDGSHLRINSSSSDIHNFGSSWTIEENTSLFTYTEGRTFDSYQSPNFVPLFPEDILNSSSVTDEHRNVCGSNTQCLFDFVTTGNKAIAEKTKQANIVFQETVEAARFVVRCPSLDRLKIGHRFVTGYKVGEKVSYSCDTGHTLEGAQNRYCLKNGTWNSVAPFCNMDTATDSTSSYWTVGRIVGLTVGLIVAVIIVILAFTFGIWWYRKSHFKKEKKYDMNDRTQNNLVYEETV